MIKKISISVVIAVIISGIMLVSCKTSKNKCCTTQCCTATDSVVKKKGETFTIELKSNVTTGYKWELDQKCSEDFIKSEKSEYIAPNEKLMGAGGKEVWTFKAKKKGTAYLIFNYKRPNEEKPGETKNIKVTVN